VIHSEEVAMSTMCCSGCSCTTRHPEVALGSVGELETCPDWIPSLDANAIIDCKTACTKELTRFEQRGIYAARVRNASSVGSRLKSQAIRLIRLRLFSLISSRLHNT